MIYKTEKFSNSKITKCRLSTVSVYLSCRCVLIVEVMLSVIEETVGEDLLTVKEI